MLISHRWIQELSGVEKDPERLALMLTMQGLPVDSVTDTASLLRKVIVGRIESSRPHPNADRLTLLTVSLGEKRHEIVCGARNMKEGDKVAVALPGTVLADGTELKRAKIRGVVSDGMCCSERELGISDDHSGIMILSSDAPVGESLAEALSRDDYVLELDVTPNRGDALSHVGVAREAAAAEGRALGMPPIELQESEEPASSRIAVEIHDPDLCQRYAARVVTGVSIGPSPSWLVARLEACGIRSINNLVDVSNYVLLEYGHPLHSFDLAKVAGAKIIVRRARPGERLVTLDGIERELQPDMLVIADAERAVALAGVMGGTNTEVGPETCDILIESAYFHPQSIRKTRKSLGMSTEASYRFERGTDYHGLIRALDRCAQLTAELGGGRVLEGRVDAEAIPPGGRSPGDARQVPLRLARLNSVLGVSIPAEEAEQILGNLGFRCEQGSDHEWMVEVPSFRPDVTREIDLIEEVARVYGYDRIPSTLAVGIPQALRLNPVLSIESQVKRVLTACGYSEAVNFSFGGTRMLDRLGIPDGDSLKDLVQIMNPLSTEEAGLRTTLIPSIIRNLSFNARRGNRSAALFEVARAYLQETGDLTQCEKCLVSGGSYGPVEVAWDRSQREQDFFDVKGTVEELLAGLGIEGAEYVAEKVPFFHPGRSAAVLIEQKRVGILGELAPRLVEEFELRGRVVFFEVDLDELGSRARLETESLSPSSSYPPAARDIAVVVGEGVTAADVTRVVRSVAGDILESLWLFDVYRGEPLAENERSLAFRILYRSPKGTLTDDRINQVQNRIVKQLKRELGARLRE